MTCSVLSVCRQRHVSCISSANRHTHFGRRVANKFGKRTRPEHVGGALERYSFTEDAGRRIASQRMCLVGDELVEEG